MISSAQLFSDLKIILLFRGNQVKIQSLSESSAGVSDVSKLGDSQPFSR